MLCRSTVRSRTDEPDLEAAASHTFNQRFELGWEHVHFVRPNKKQPPHPGNGAECSASSGALSIGEISADQVAISTVVGAAVGR